MTETTHTACQPHLKQNMQNMELTVKKVALVITALAIITCASCCEVPRTFLYKNVTAVREGRQYVVGILVTCSSGYYAAICQDESDVGELCSTLLDFDEGDAIPYNSSVHGNLPQNTIYLSGNVTCPSNAANLSDCTADERNETDCDEPLVLECYDNVMVPLSSSLISSTTSPTPSASSNTTTPTGDSEAISVGLIAGVTVAAVVVVLLVVVGVVAVVGLLVYKNKRKSAVIPISVKPKAKS